MSGEPVRAPHATVDVKTTEWSMGAGDGRVYVGHAINATEMTTATTYASLNGARLVPPSSIIEIPEAWQPAPCGCDHTNIPEERMREAYEEKHGVDVRVAKLLRHGDVIYDTHYRNTDGSPWQWRVSGQIKLWKRSPDRFRLPLKRGMHNYGALHPDSAWEFRTQEHWALSYGEKLSAARRSRERTAGS